MEDRIEITGITGTGHHGVFDFETRDGQTFVVDLTLWLDLAPAAAEDDLALTLDYGVLAQGVLDEIEGEPVRLIETLAQRIAERCLGHPRVHQVDVTVHKPEAPMPVPVADVSVTVVRRTPA